ncbi:hypothetical protein DAI22_04g115650 [Oryza sativa Japonica Group]|nr:hypothetical protein DAI22_04g115650 [Oryza sativa Japonica Group]
MVNYHSDVESERRAELSHHLLDIFPASPHLPLNFSHSPLHTRPVCIYPPLPPPPPPLSFCSSLFFGPRADICSLQPRREKKRTGFFLRSAGG